MPTSAEYKRINYIIINSIAQWQWSWGRSGEASFDSSPPQVHHTSYIIHVPLEAGRESAAATARESNSKVEDSGFRP